MRILMLGNSFTSTNNMPKMLAELTGAEVIHHTRGGARLSEQMEPIPGWAVRPKRRSKRRNGTTWCSRR